jgi:hypothetical protein
MSNEHGLDADYFIKLCAREFNPEVIRRQTPSDLARALARAARTACASVLREEEFEWTEVLATGQIRAGDKVRVYDAQGVPKTYRVHEVLEPGDPKREEIILNRRRNHYFITCMLLDRTSWAKRALTGYATMVAGALLLGGLLMWLAVAILNHFGGSYGRSSALTTTSARCAQSFNDLRLKARP